MIAFWGGLIWNWAISFIGNETIIGAMGGFSISSLYIWWLARKPAYRLASIVATTVIWLFAGFVGTAAIRDIEWNYPFWELTLSLLDGYTTVLLIWILGGAISWTVVEWSLGQAEYDRDLLPLIQFALIGGLVGGVTWITFENYFISEAPIWAVIGSGLISWLHIWLGNRFWRGREFETAMSW